MSAVIEHPSLLAKVASKYSVEPSKMLETLKATAFRGDVSNAQMMALLIVADQHGLNPWTKEIYAFPDKNNGIVPVVGIDGWVRIINEHPQFDGVEFETTEDSCACTIYRKDRSHPTRITEYLAECKRGTQPWGSHPKRMLRHKALIQCARVAFGFGGIYDPDEAERIVERQVEGERMDAPRKTGTEALKERLRVNKETGEIHEPATLEEASAEFAGISEEQKAALEKVNAEREAAFDRAKSLELDKTEAQK